MKKFYLYASILGFNFLIVCTIFLIWYYFTDSRVEITVQTTTSETISPIGGYSGDLVSIPLLNSTMSQFKSQLEKCDTKLGECRTYTTLSIPNYQLNSLMDTIHLAKDETKPFGYFTYNYRGWVGYQHMSLQVFINIFGYYTNFLLYGIVSSIIGTIVIVFAWKKTQRAANVQRVSN